MCCNNYANHTIIYIYALDATAHFLCNYASVGLFDWEDHVSVFAPDYVVVLDGELHEVLRLDVAVVLWGGCARMHGLKSTVWDVS